MRRRLIIVVAAAITVMYATTVPIAGARDVAARTTFSVHGDTVVRVAHVSPSSFVRPGPYRVGELTMSVPVTSEGYTTSVEVWYPSSSSAKLATYNIGNWFPPALLKDLTSHPAVMATATYSSGGVRNARAAHGRFPLVLFSHGWAGVRDDSSFLTARLASWGFVVAAPEHPGRDLTEVIGTYMGIGSPTSDPHADVQDLLATLGALRSLADGGPLFGHVDAARFVVVGHSAGANAAEELASLESATTAPGTTNPDAGFIALAGGSGVGTFPPPTAPFDVVPSEPGVVVSASNDVVVPSGVTNFVVNHLRAPHRLVVLASSGHLVFSNTCAIIPGTGALVGLLHGLGISLPSAFNSGASDGCRAPDVSVTRQWPVIGQVSVGAVRWMFGFDSTTAALDRLTTTYPKLVATDTTGLVK